MGWRSHLFRNSDIDAKRKEETPQPPQADRAAQSDRRQEIVDALTAHLETVYRLHAGTADPITFDPDLNLYEAGYLDSLSASEFLLLAEGQFGVALPDWLIGGQANSLAALAGYIEAELERQRSEI